MDLKYIFSSFLLIDTLDKIDNNTLLEYSYEYKNQFPSVIKSNYGGWQSDTLILQNPEIGKLIDVILDKVNCVKKELGLKESVDLYVNNIWININSKGTFNRPHIHPDCLLSGVYYVSTPKDCGGISFLHPAKNQQYHIEDGIVEEFTNFSAASWAVDPEVGKLVIFPAWLEHYVEVNQNNDDRISIAFNIGIRTKQ